MQAQWASGVFKMAVKGDENEVELLPLGFFYYLIHEDADRIANDDCWRTEKIFRKGNQHRISNEILCRKE